MKSNSDFSILLLIQFPVKWGTTRYISAILDFPGIFSRFFKMADIYRVVPHFTGNWIRNIIPKSEFYFIHPFKSYLRKIKFGNFPHSHFQNGVTEIQEIGKFFWLWIIREQCWLSIYSNKEKNVLNKNCSKNGLKVKVIKGYLLNASLSPSRGSMFTLKC